MEIPHGQIKLNYDLEKSDVANSWTNKMFDSILYSTYTATDSSVVKGPQKKSKIRIKKLFSNCIQLGD